MGWFFDDEPKKPVKKTSFWDWLFEPERKNLDKKPMNKEQLGHSLSQEQVDEIRTIQNNAKRKKGFWD